MKKINKLGKINNIQEINLKVLDNIKKFLENIDKEELEDLNMNQVILRSIIKDKLIENDLFKVKELIANKISFSTFYDGKNESENENYIPLGYFNEEENKDDFLDVYIDSNNLDLKVEGDNDTFFDIYDRFINGTIDNFLNLLYQDYYEKNFGNESIEKYYDFYTKTINDLK